MGTLGGKVAIVTGAGRGVGRGIALALTAESARAVICGRDGTVLNETAELIRSRGGVAHTVQCDVGDPAALANLVDETVATFGGVDILVNNAMQIPLGGVLEVTDAAVDDGWRTGPLAALRLMRLCHPYLRGGGVVVNVSSGASIYPGTPRRGIYSALKTAMNSISNAAATEWGRDGIRVNVIFPFANSDAVARLMEREPELSRQIISETPLGRVGDPEKDIGRAVVFLCGPDAAFITGVNLPVDGGRSYVR